MSPVVGLVAARPRASCRTGPATKPKPKLCPAKAAEEIGYMRNCMGKSCHGGRWARILPSGVSVFPGRNRDAKVLRTPFERVSSPADSAGSCCARPTPPSRPRDYFNGVSVNSLIRKITCRAWPISTFRPSPRRRRGRCGCTRPRCRGSGTRGPNRPSSTPRNGCSSPCNRHYFPAAGWPSGGVFASSYVGWPCPQR